MLHRFVEGIEAIDEAEDGADGWKTKGKTKGKGQGKAKGKGKGKSINKAQKISNTIVQIFKAIAMEGASASDVEVQSFLGKTYLTNNCKKSFSALVKMPTNYAALMSSNSGERMISFKIKLDDDELTEDLEKKALYRNPC